MRFYRINRTYRTALTAFWCAMFLLYAVNLAVHHGRHSYQLLIWLLLAITQLATIWTYVELTSDSIVTHFLFVQRSTPLRLLRYAGVPRSSSRWLAKSLEIETMNEPPTYLAVEEKDAFLRALQDRGYTAKPTRYATSPLGLSL